VLRSAAQRSIDPIAPSKVGLAGLVEVVQAVEIQDDFSRVATFPQPAAPNPFQVQDIPLSAYFFAKIAAQLGMNHVGERPPQCC
jgi:hypothetical protein